MAIEIKKIKTDERMETCALIIIFNKVFSVKKK